MNTGPQTDWLHDAMVTQFAEFIAGHYGWQLSSITPSNTINTGNPDTARHYSTLTFLVGSSYPPTHEVKLSITTEGLLSRGTS